MSKFTETIESIWPGAEWTVAVGKSPAMECCGTAHLDPMDNIESDEPSFSWARCESCGSTLGGDRHDAHALHREAFGPNAKRPDEVHHISICTDCACYHANGDEPEQWHG